MRLLLASAIFLCAACTSEQRDPPGGSSDSAAAREASALADTPAERMGCTERTLTGSGVGTLRIGATVDSVRTQCTVTRDTVELRAEGMPSRVVDVAFGADTIEAEVVDGRIWRVAIEGAGFATDDSLRVGSRLSQLLRHPDATPATGEGKLFVLLPDKCGMSFRLAARPSDLMRSGRDGAGLRTLPGSLQVDQILIFGCRTPTD